MGKRGLILSIFFFLSCGEERFPSPVFDLEGFSQCREGFLSIPFPSEFRRGDGRINLSCLELRESESLLFHHVKSIESEMKEWGIFSSLYFLFNEEIDLSYFPDDVSSSLEEDFPFSIVNIDPSCSTYGEKIPFSWFFSKRRTGFLPPGTLVFTPVPGAHLSPDCFYAGFVLGPLYTRDGRKFRQSDDVKNLLEGKCRHETACEGIKYFIDFLREHEIKRERVLTFTVFRAGNPRKELLRAGQYLLQLPPPQLKDISYVTTVTQSFPGVITSTYHIFEGYVSIHTFQKGNPPYFEDDSGYIEFDPNGNPVFLREEDVRFTFAYPQGLSGKVPCVLYVHGTGGSAYSVFEDFSALNITGRNMAVMSFDSPLHGKRIPDAWDPVFTFFNFLNLRAARDNIRETALEILQFISFLHSFSLDENSGIEGRKIICDTNNIFYMGHSQGAITGIPYLGVDHRVKGAVLSGGGGILLYSLINKTEPFPIQPLVKMLFGTSEELKPYNLLLNIFQIFFEPADPASYAPYLIYDPRLSDKPLNLFVSEGMLDGFTPPETSEALCGAMGVPQIEPVSRVVPLYRIERFKKIHKSPAIFNMDSGGGKFSTAGFIQFPHHGHFALFESPCGFEMWGSFFASLSLSRPLIDTSCLLK